MRRGIAWAGGILLALAVAGCGSSAPEEKIETVRAMGSRAAARAEARAQAADEDADAGEAEAEEAPPVFSTPNRPPRIRSLEIRPTQHLAGQDVRARALVDDPDGDDVTLEYTWLVNGVESEAAGDTFSTASLQRGDTLQLRVVASDERGSSEPVEGPVLEIENGPPRIVSSPAAPGPDGVFHYQVRAEDPDSAGNLRYSLAQAPDGMTVTRLGGLVEWRPRPDQTGVHVVEIAVEDAEGAVTRQRFELTLEPPDGGVPAAAAP